MQDREIQDIEQLTTWIVDAAGPGAKETQRAAAYVLLVRSLVETAEGAFPKALYVEPCRVKRRRLCAKNR